MEETRCSMMRHSITETHSSWTHGSLWILLSDKWFSPQPMVMMMDNVHWINIVTSIFGPFDFEQYDSQVQLQNFCFLNGCHVTYVTSHSRSMQQRTQNHHNAWCNTIPYKYCNTMQYHTIPRNTMRYHAGYRFRYRYNQDDDEDGVDKDDELLLFWWGQGLPLMLMWRGGLQNMERWPRRPPYQISFFSNISFSV